MNKDERKHVMFRNLKALGLALVAAFALSAVAASGASAFTQFTTGSANTTLTATQTSNQVFTLEGTESLVSCKELASTVTGVGTSQASITAVPAYSNDCTVTVGGSTFSAEIMMEGCAYIFKATGTVEIECPTGKSIVVTASIAGSFRECIKVHAQTPTVATVEYENKNNAGTGKMDVEITSKAKGITYERVGLCQGAVNEANDAKYEGTVTVNGEDQSTPPKPLDVTVS